jgi:hypothetical protein
MTELYANSHVRGSPGKGCVPHASGATDDSIKVCIHLRLSEGVEQRLQHVGFDGFLRDSSEVAMGYAL